MEFERLALALAFAPDTEPRELWAEAEGAALPCPSERGVGLEARLAVSCETGATGAGRIGRSAPRPAMTTDRLTLEAAATAAADDARGALTERAGTGFFAAATAAFSRTACIAMTARCVAVGGKVAEEEEEAAVPTAVASPRRVVDDEREPGRAELARAVDAKGNDEDTGVKGWDALCGPRETATGAELENWRSAIGWRCLAPELTERPTGAALLTLIEAEELIAGAETAGALDMPGKLAPATASPPSSSVAAHSRNSSSVSRSVVGRVRSEEGAVDRESDRGGERLRAMLLPIDAEEARSSTANLTVDAGGGESDSSE